jgi:trans-aconitate 2-methyltransferase
MADGTRDWDARTYDRVSGPQAEWSRAIIDRLALRGDETVLDAGCGSGRVTEALLERLPRGRVIAVDGSAAMIEQARERLDPARATLIHSDLLALDLDEEADAVFSNAVFHWLRDHRSLFGVLHSALRPGGRLEAQCGGEGNVAGFFAAMEPIAARAPYREHLEGFAPTHFAAPPETEALLAEAGFEDISCNLESRPTRPDEPREFVRAVCIGAHAEQLPEDLREPFLEEVLEALGPDPEFDYVRLNISARKGAAPA